VFWTQMRGKVSGEMLAAVHPVGGGQKLAALEEIIAAEGVEGGGVMYVGDSITDAPPLAAVKAWGGVSLSFNGNGYAIAAAEYAAASPNAEVQAQLAEAFAAGGRDAAEAAVRSWPKPAKGTPPRGKTRATVGVVAEEREKLAEASAAARLSVRGERIARLG
jgi:energy-converting hydrogenase A subunit R